MSKSIKLPPTAKPRSLLKAGKGWRLVNPKRTGSVKAQVVATSSSGGDQYAVCRLKN